MTTEEPPKKKRKRLSDEGWNALISEYRRQPADKPPNHRRAAKKAGCTRVTAQRYYERGGRNREPIRDLLFEERAQARGKIAKKLRSKGVDLPNGDKALSEAQAIAARAEEGVLVVGVRRVAGQLLRVGVKMLGTAERLVAHAAEDLDRQLREGKAIKLETVLKFARETASFSRDATGIVAKAIELERVLLGQPIGSIEIKSTSLADAINEMSSAFRIVAQAKEEGAPRALVRQLVEQGLIIDAEYEVTSDDNDDEVGVEL